ncbi:glycosyltransferase [Thiohalobacter thiocyanaticus]|uniref:Glycosyltransferase n=1 Tax=Thiohalobacter thiocyanaticus TaxID=585455 RepID=A0A1Z4VSV5_9GAMM|nr:glycosyltransferase family 4 protein [Thiohalobacter thiocyanaticus]BAZ94545.1 glycosyltransferase [Thiohalobacter thiocyanaticus]
MYENKTVLFAANRGYALLSSRRELINRFLADGWQVVLATANDEDSRVLEDLGASLEPMTFNRGGVSPLADWCAYRRFRQIIRKWTPSLVQLFHAKPVIMGTVIARGELGQSVKIVNTITGLGHAFVKGGLVTQIASAGYRMALPRADITIFQNRDDRAMFLKNHWLPDASAELIAGSGVPLDRFTYINRIDHDPERPVVVMLGRLLNQKGIPEFERIARRVRKEIPQARFCLAGEEEPNHPDSVSMDWLSKASDVEYLGRLSDVVPLLEKADLLLFPSYYREGVPRVVMEAAATGLATVAFDVPGVREAVRNGETGYLVPERDVEAMTVRVLELLRDHSRRLKMGRRANELARSAFDIHAVQEAYLGVYRSLGIYI